MDARDRRRTQELLRVASRLPPAARAEFLLRAEPRRAELRDEVSSLLAHDAGRGEFIASALADSPSAGPFRLLDRLGEAPPARLYRACRADAPSEIVLLAVAGPGPAAARVAAALAEQAQRQRALEGPGLARLLDASATADGRLLIAFEPVEGVPLVELCDALAMSLPERVALVERVARIVARAHAAAVVPLGLLPWSVLGVWSAGRPDVALIAIDPWPLLALLEPERRAQAELLAGLETAPPEALRGGARGVHTDVFALGALLFESVTGTPPLGLRRLAGQRPLREELRLASRITAPLASERFASGGEEFVEFARLRAGEVATVLADLRSGLDTILASALAADVAARTASAQGFADELAAWSRSRTTSSALRDVARGIRRWTRPFDKRESVDRGPGDPD